MEIGWHVVLVVIVEGDDMWVVVIGCWTCLQCSMWDRGVDIETPHTGSCRFTESFQYKCSGTVEDVDFGLGEGDRAIGVTKLSHAEEVVGESVHDVAIIGAWWE